MSSICRELILSFTNKGSQEHNYLNSFVVNLVCLLLLCFKNTLRVTCVTLFSLGFPETSLQCLCTNQETGLHPSRCSPVCTVLGKENNEKGHTHNTDTVLCATSSLSSLLRFFSYFFLKIVQTCHDLLSFLQNIRLCLIQNFLEICVVSMQLNSTVAQAIFHDFHGLKFSETCLMTQKMANFRKYLKCT